MADDKNKRTYYKPGDITFDEIKSPDPEALKRMNEIASKYVDDMLRGDMYRMFTPNPYAGDTHWFLKPDRKPAPPDGKGDIIDISAVPDPPKELL